MAPTDQPAFALTLLGPMALTFAGERLPLPASRKTRALLAYLAAGDRPARRDHLCTLFWDVPDDPRASLRWSLSKLRGLFDPATATPLIADRETAQLDHAAIGVDWRDLRQLARGDLRQADADTLRRWAAVDSLFLQGLELPRSNSYQAWLIAMREDVRQWRSLIIRECLRRAIPPEEAIGLARQLVQLDPLDASAWILLIDRLQADGRRAEVDEQRALAIKTLGEGATLIPGELRGRAPPAPDRAAKDERPAQHIHFCTASDGTSLAYSVVGTGPPLIKAANWLNHLEHDWDSPVWRHWIDGIVRCRSLIRYDERGNGLSDWNAADISFDAFVDDLASVVDAAGVDRFDLLGISQGCSVSIAYAVRHPEKVRRLILYGGYAAGWKVRAKPGEIERREAMMTLTREGWGRNNPAFRQMFSTLFFPDATPAETAWFNELQRISTSPDNAVRLQSAFASIDVRHLLPHITVPTLVLHTRDDAIIPFDVGRAMASAIPGAEFVALESRNHLLLEKEAAWPRALDCIQAFLKEPL